MTAPPPRRPNGTRATPQRTPTGAPSSASMRGLARRVEKPRRGVLPPSERDAPDAGVADARVPPSSPSPSLPSPSLPSPASSSSSSPSSCVATACAASDPADEPHGRDGVGGPRGVLSPRVLSRLLPPRAAALPAGEEVPCRGEERSRGVLLCGALLCGVLPPSCASALSATCRGEGAPCSGDAPELIISAWAAAPRICPSTSCVCSCASTTASCSVSRHISNGRPRSRRRLGAVRDRHMPQNADAASASTDRTSRSKLALSG